MGKALSTAWFMAAVALILNPEALCTSQLVPKHMVTVEDSQTLKDVLYMQLSPDGKMLVYIVGNENGELWLIETKTRSTPRKLAEGTVPMWSPDSKHLAYYASRSGTLQLWVLDVVSGRTEQVTKLPGGIDPDPSSRFSGWYYDPLRYSWSPDGKKLVFASQVPVKTDSGNARIPVEESTQQREAWRPLILTNSTPPEWTLQGVFHAEHAPPAVTGNVSGNPHANQELSFAPRKVSQLFVVDWASRLATQITNDEEIYFNPNWSPDGKQVVCASSEGRPLLGYGSTASNIFVIDVASGKKFALTTGSGDKRLPFWSPDGKSVAFYGGEHFGSQSVFVVSINGGKPVNVTASLNRCVAEFYWSADSRSIIFNYLDGVSWPVARVDIHRRKITVISGNEAALREPLTVGGSDTVVWQQSDGSSQGVLWMLRDNAELRSILIDLNPQIRGWDLGAQEIVSWRNSRGDELEGILIKPVGYQMGRKYPLVVDCYPQLANGFFADVMNTGQALAARGYAVFYPNARSRAVWMNPFKSQGFDQAVLGSKGWDLTFDDAMSGVDEVIRRGVADPKRMGLYGFSNGAAIVNFLLTRTGRFKCAVSVAGALAVDWTLPFFLSTSNPFIPTAAGATPWENPSLYIQLSTIYSMDKVTTPVLLADGDLDGDSLLTDIEMYNALRWLGKEVTFLRYPDQGHGFTDEALRDFWERENAFFDRYLRPENRSTGGNMTFLVVPRAQQFASRRIRNPQVCSAGCQLALRRRPCCLQLPRKPFRSP